MIRAAAIVVVLGVAAPAVADDDAWSPTTIVNAGAQVGPEGPPGAMLLAEVGVGHRIREIMWHARGAYAIFAGRLGGGSTTLTYRAWDVRVGPTWWRCRGSSCVGLSTDGGLQYLRIHETGGDGDPGVPPLDNVRHDYEAIVDLRTRYLRSAKEHFSFELNIGLRIKARVADLGDHVNLDEDRMGAGLLLGVGINAAF